MPLGTGRLSLAGPDDGKTSFLFDRSAPRHSAKGSCRPVDRFPPRRLQMKLPGAARLHAGHGGHLAGTLSRRVPSRSFFISLFTRLLRE
jgi:hypothetical protein